ncbi:MAG: hypothetical protein R3E66_10265 [bacterium]
MFVWDMYGSDGEPVAAPSEDAAPEPREPAKPVDDQDDLLL